MLEDPCLAISLQFIVLVGNYMLQIFQTSNIVADEMFILQQIATVNQQHYLSVLPCVKKIIWASAKKLNIKIQLKVIEKGTDVRKHTRAFIPNLAFSINFGYRLIDEHTNLNHKRSHNTRKEEVTVLISNCFLL